MHQPRHLSEPARLFGPDFLEVVQISSLAGQNHSNLSADVHSYRVVCCPFVLGTDRCILVPSFRLSICWPPPDFWANPILPTRYVSVIPFESYIKTIACFFVGNVIWTILEYTLHRFLFHVDEMLPDTPIFITLHFLMHGIHHYLPMDR